MPQLTTYDARRDDETNRENPAGIVRRVEDADGGFVDEGLRVDLGWRSYDVCIAAGSLANYAAEDWDEIALLSNESVMPLYGRGFVQRRVALGLKTIEIVAPEGESAKNLEMMASAYDELAQARLTRRGAIGRWRLTRGIRHVWKRRADLPKRRGRR